MSIFSNVITPGFLLAACLALTACGNKSGGSHSNDANGGGIAWEKIPAEFNPREAKAEIDLRGIQKIKMNLFGFNGDVRVQYVDGLNSESGFLQLFTVEKDSRTSLGGVDIRQAQNILQIENYGSYECSIKTKNNEISDVKGACYVRVILNLPKGAEVEAYNLDRILTARFYAMSNEEFLSTLHDAFSDKKISVIESYLESYRAIRRRPVLNSQQVGEVVHEVVWPEQKLEALRKLHLYVSDRANLGTMIDNEFSYFEREKARKIVGL